MRRNILASWNRTRLRVTLVLFFLALLIPTAILIKQAWSQLKWEAFHQQRAGAEEFVARIDRRYSELIEAESARRVTDYAFLNIAGDPETSFLQRSPLSEYPVKSALPGVIGYFQIDPAGHFSTPLLPDETRQASDYGIAGDELEQRTDLRNRLLTILADNQLLQRPSPIVQDLPEEALPSSPAPGASASAEREADLPAGKSTETQAPIAQSGFDKLQKTRQKAELKKDASGQLRVEDLKLEERYQQERSASKDAISMEEATQAKTKRVLRKEQNVLPAEAPRAAPAPTVARQDRDRRVSMFESEIDAFEFSVLDSGQFVLYRKVWRDGQRYIQGLLLEADVLVGEIIRPAFYDTALSATSRMAVAYQGNVLSVLGSKGSREYYNSAQDMQGTLLHRARLSAPLHNMELIFSIEQLPAGPGAGVVTWLALIILLILCGGFLLLYRLALRQITLAQQQQDFVSAVSHELKTPLTSIRMYGEMLREGWAPEEKRKSYYDFIFDESERLTRLINNVLQLARMTRSELKLECKAYKLHELMDLVRSKITSQVERAGFDLALACPEELQELQLQVDADHFVQVIINLVDNALKFSARAETKSITIQCRLSGKDRVQIAVRDYGPGIARDQLRKIFRLFYRSENELTRETVGTGIGLALVQQLVQAMHGEVDVVNQEPGAEFCVTFPLRTDTAG